MLMRTTICDAIRQRKVLQFTYTGTLRTVEPHLLGYDADGDLTVSAWQRLGTGEGWRDFHVSKVHALATTGATFGGPRPGYNPRDETIDRVVCRF